MRSTSLVALVLLLLLAGCAGLPVGDGSSADASERTEYEATVVEVVDGDTLTVEFRNGSRADVRLLGVDTPEVHVENDPSEFEGVPDAPAGNDWLRDWGHRASEFARTELAGERVRLVVDSAADRRGSYGRLLVYVYHDENLFNRRLLERGYARLYDSPFGEREQFREAEAAAQSGNVGLWAFERGSADLS